MYIVLLALSLSRRALEAGFVRLRTILLVLLLIGLAALVTLIVFQRRPPELSVPGRARLGCGLGAAQRL